jgi:GTPase involved in cell partitioning and DNA repair
MQQEDKELLFIKHYSNLQRLAAKQLNAIKEEKLNTVNELVAQKQIIMNNIVAIQGDFDINNCQLEVKEKLAELVSRINASENESRQILSDNCSSVSKKMMAGRKEIAIHQAYESSSFQGNGLMFNIKK